MTRTRLLILTAVLGSYFWCFGSVLLQNRSFGFRDAANYYDPLFEWECREWRAGRVPLWNPLDNAGTPVLADATSSVLYPGKLLFALPTSQRLRYHLYVSLHVLLAAAMAYRLARHWDCSREAAGLAALSYAFGGSVLFQYCNVVFLVGAAWLPQGLLAADRMLHERSLRWAVMLGATLALMVLGGDPQMAYHTGMLAALYAWLHRGDAARESAGGSRRWRRSRPVLLATAAIAGLVLALVQILPSVEWTRQSSRCSYDAPRNLYEAGRSIEHVHGVQEFAHDAAAGILASPPPGTHLRHAYEFSVGPWHLAEFVWPNFFGRDFPINARWARAIPAEGRTWTPSLYLGLLPCVLAVCTWRVRRCDARIRFLSIVTALALLGSFGWYGIGWLVDELRAGLMNQAPGDSVLGEPVGGLYWMFVTLLPGYVYFRYPAKLLVIVSLGMSLLAARGWGDFVQRDSRRTATAFVVIAAVSLLAAAGFGLCQSPWHAWLGDVPPDAIFGPLDIPSATSGLLSALLHAAVLGLAYWLVLRRDQQRINPARGMVLLGITAIELCAANGWMTHSIPADVWSARPLLAKAIRLESNQLPPRLYRDSTESLLPAAWSKVSDKDRLRDVVAWERATLLPKHHLSADIGVVGSHTTLTSADWQGFALVARRWQQAHTPGQHDTLLNSMSVQFIATDGDGRSTHVRELAAPWDEQLRLYADSRAFPRTWIVRDVQVIPPLDEHSPAAIEQRTREVFLDDDWPRDLRTVAILEADDPPSLPKFPNLRPFDEAETCEVTRYGPQTVEIHVKLAEPGCLVLNDTFYPGWRAIRETVGQTHELSIYRANRLMRAVLLPAGQHHVVFAYRPLHVLLGGWVSGCAWLLLLMSNLIIGFRI